jgi:hypothetical protein
VIVVLMNAVMISGQLIRSTSPICTGLCIASCSFSIILGSPSKSLSYLHFLLYGARKAIDPNSTREPTVAPTQMLALVPVDNVGEIFEGI